MDDDAFGSAQVTQLVRDATMRGFFGDVEMARQLGYHEAADALRSELGRRALEACKEMEGDTDV